MRYIQFVLGGGPDALVSLGVLGIMNQNQPGLGKPLPQKFMNMAAGTRPKLIGRKICQFDTISGQWLIGWLSLYVACEKTYLGGGKEDDEGMTRDGTLRKGD